MVVFLYKLCWGSFGEQKSHWDSAQGNQRIPAALWWSSEPWGSSCRHRQRCHGGDMDLEERCLQAGTAACRKNAPGTARGLGGPSIGASHGLVYMMRTKLLKSRGEPETALAQGWEGSHHKQLPRAPILLPCLPQTPKSQQ